MLRKSLYNLNEKINTKKKRIKKPRGTKKQSKEVKGKNAGAKKIMKPKGSKSQHEESYNEKPRAEPEGSKDVKSQVQDASPALVLRDRLEPKGEGPRQPKRRNIKKAKAVTSTLNEKVNTKKKRIKKPEGTKKQSKNAGANKIMKFKGWKSQHEESDDEKPRAEPKGSKDAKSQVLDAPPALVLRDRLEPKGQGPKQPKRRNIKKAKTVTSSKTDSHAREMLPAMKASTRPEPVDEHNSGYGLSDRIGSHEKEDALTRASSDLAKEGSKSWFVVCYLVKRLNRWMARLSSKKSQQRSSTLVSDRSLTSPESLTASCECPRSLKRMNKPGHDFKSETSAFSRQEGAARQQHPWFVRSGTCAREEEEASVCSSIMFMVFYETYPDGPRWALQGPIQTHQHDDFV